MYGFMAMPKQNAKHQFKFAFYPDPTGAVRELRFYSSPANALDGYSSEGKLIFCAVKKDNVLVRYFECTATLRRYAKDVALDVIHLWENPPAVVLDYLNSDNESKRDAARTAAKDAAWDAAKDAAKDAARAKYDKWLIDRLTTPIAITIESTKNEATPH